MSSRTDIFAEIRQIADDMSDSPAEPEQLARLEALLKGNKDAQQFYYDYMSMHAHMMASAERNTQVVYRRMTQVVTEEVVVTAGEEPVTEPVVAAQVIHQEFEPPKSSKVFVFGGLLLVLVALLAGWWLFNVSSTHYAKLEQGQLAIIEYGQQSAGRLGAGQYRAEQKTQIALTNGNRLTLAAYSVLKIFNANEVQLKQGAVEFESVVADNLVIRTDHFTVNTNGSALSLDLTAAEPVLTSGEQTLLLPKRWRPRHYWNFDGSGEWALDLANNAHGKPASGATRTAGVVGNGAFTFDNSQHARIDVGSGGGTALATGSFSVQDGITIEVLLQSQFSGQAGEVDEIFRKDRGDGELRILLSFQHDIHIKEYLRPSGDFGQSLSFGLYVVGQGYHELKLALDGQQGRPSLAQLRSQPHHVVASYDVKSGLKAIYINGVMLAHFQYPAGSKMLSGGPGKAAIGNNPAQHRWHEEAYAGIIDELAFYDFSLPSYIVARHHQLSQQGGNYFGLPHINGSLPTEVKLTLPAFTTLQLDPLTGLPANAISD